GPAGLAHGREGPRAHRRTHCPIGTHRQLLRRQPGADAVRESHRVSSRTDVVQFGGKEGTLMVQVILTEEQARLFREAVGQRVQLGDPRGKVLAQIEPEMNPEFLAELKRRAASPGPWYTGAQVQARLHALQEEWDRTGGFDEAYMRAFLQRLNAADPGHMR